MAITKSQKSVLLGELEHVVGASPPVAAVCSKNGYIRCECCFDTLICLNYTQLTDIESQHYGCLINYCVTQYTRLSFEPQSCFLTKNLRCRLTCECLGLKQ